MQGKSHNSPKKLAAKPAYVSPNQLTLIGFETPFVNQLNKDNRWVKMAQAIPWDKVVPYYDQLFSGSEGRAPISGRVIIGAMIIKHIEDLTDRTTILHIQENIFMQYFLGYSSFTNEAPLYCAAVRSYKKADESGADDKNKRSDSPSLHGGLGAGRAFR